MALLRKMIWLPGGELERNEECTFEPWRPDVELDKREKHIKQKVGKPTKPLIITERNSQEKHPVSLLGEYCSKRKRCTPIYELCFECGPDHKKSFLFKVTVNDVEYKPNVASRSKKMAKALAAQTCLQALGILPDPDSKTVKKPLKNRRTVELSFNMFGNYWEMYYKSNVSNL